MALQAVVLRELREIARKRRTYVLRFLAAGSLAVPVFFTYATEAVSSANLGPGLFSSFSFLLNGLVLAVTPAIAGSSIASERAHGDYELLFLSDLKPWQMLLGRMAGHLTVVVLLLFSGLPVLFFITLLGGVSPDQILTTFLLLVTVAVVVESISLAASVYSKSPHRAVITVYLLLFVFGIVVPSILFSMAELIELNALAEFIKESAFVLLTPMNPRRVSVVICVTEGMAVSVAAFLWAVRGMRRVYAQEPIQTLPRQQHVGKRKLGPMKGNLFCWRECRMSVFVGVPAFVLLLLALGVFGETVFRRSGRPFFEWALGASSLLWPVLLLLVMTRAGYLFSREKEDGTLQTLLCTPLSNGQILHGKLLVILQEFGIAGFILILVRSGSYLIGLSHQQLNFTVPGSLAFSLAGSLVSLSLFTIAPLFCSLLASNGARAILYSIGILATVYLAQAGFWALLSAMGGHEYQLKTGIMWLPVILKAMVTAVFYAQMKHNLRRYALRAD